jgi:hypothetical protein
MSATRMRPLALIACLGLLLPGRELAAQVSQMTFTLPPGPYRVGFRAYELRDRTRMFEGGVDHTVQPRPLQTSVWYPARPAGRSEPMRYEEYAVLTAQEAGFQRLAPAQRRSRLDQFADSLRRWNEFEAPTTAFLNAPPASGSFPVVIYGPSFNAPSFENSVLAEFLASHGYIVVSSPCMGWHQRAMTQDALGIEAQVRDMAFLLDFARTLPGADTTQVASMGFSWGGLSDVVLQLRDPRVRAVVSLDGGVAYFWPLFKTLPSAGTARMDVPFLFLKSRPVPRDTAIKYHVDTSLTFYDSLSYSDAYVVHFDSLVHRNFGAHFLRLLPRDRDEAVQATVNYGYEQIARYVLSFLDTYLKNDSAGRAFLQAEPERNGVRPGFARVERKTGATPAAYLFAFSRYLGSAGPREAPAALARIRERQPGYRLTEGEVNGWGYQLLRAGRTDDAIGVFTLNTIMYPSSQNVWDSLGEAYMDKGDRERAIANYEHSLALDSTNTNAVRRLQRLRAPARP